VRSRTVKTRWIPAEHRCQDQAGNRVHWVHSIARLILLVHAGVVGSSSCHYFRRGRLRWIAGSGAHILPVPGSQAAAGWRTTFVQPSSRLSKFL
jgi:hypothetical protein